MDVTKQQELALIVKQIILVSIVLRNVISVVILNIKIVSNIMKNIVKYAEMDFMVIIVLYHVQIVM